MKPEQEYLRQTIREWLSLLRRELGHYEQTTHGSLTANGCQLYQVVESLVKCYNQPNSHEVSELTQRISGFLEAAK